MANYLPATYQQTGWSYGNTQPMYQSYGQGQSMNQQQYPSQQMSGTQGMKWVDGEAEAKGTPIPAGASQFAMWDINEPVIYIKSLNQMGMPMPMQIARYTLEKPKHMSGAEENKPQENKGEYVTRDDLEQMKTELKELLGNQQSKRSGRNDANA